MPTDTKLKELIINELTEEQYKALTPNDDELYLTPDGSITKNENGSYVLDGDVDITGTTKLNGGIKPIHTYNFHDQDGEYILDVWFEKQYGWNEYNFIGVIVINGDTPHLIHGDYILDEGKIQYLTAFAVFSYDEDALGAIHYGGENADTLHKTRFVLAGKAQEKLYTHTLTLTADKSYTLIYPSTSNLKADSVADLRTIMKVSSTNDNVILPLCATDLTGTAVLQVTTALCKIGTTNVTAVTDNVTL